MNDQRKDNTDPKRPPERNRHKLLQTHNLPTYDIENTNDRNKGKDLFLVKKAANCSLCNRRDATKDPEAQENYFTLINTP